MLMVLAQFAALRVQYGLGISHRSYLPLGLALRFYPTFLILTLHLCAASSYLTALHCHTYTGTACPLSSVQVCMRDAIVKYEQADLCTL